MLRVILSVCVVGITVDVCALQNEERCRLSALVTYHIGKYNLLPPADYYDNLVAAGLAESCSETEVLKANAAFSSHPGTEDVFAAAISSAEYLAAQSPEDASFVSCDAMYCPNIQGAFVVCAFNSPEYY